MRNELLTLNAWLDVLGLIVCVGAAAFFGDLVRHSRDIAREMNGLCRSVSKSSWRMDEDILTGMCISEALLLAGISAYGAWQYLLRVIP